MITFSSTTTEHLARPPRPSRRRIARATALVATLLAALAVGATPAGAVLTPVGGTTVGLQPRVAADLFAGPLRFSEGGALEEVALQGSFANPGGDPVLHGSNIYAIYWDPTAHYHGDWQGVIDRFLRGIAAESGTLGDVFSVDAQYTDTSNAPAYDRMTFRGASTDTHAYPAAGCTDPHPLAEDPTHLIAPLTCLTDAQVQQELQSFITAHGLSRGMNNVYYLLTPPGVAVCLDSGGANGHCSDFSASTHEEETGQFESTSYQHSFCSYHSDVNPGGLAQGDASTLLYAVVPWIAGGLGDGQLRPADQTASTFCQTGNWEPTKSEEIGHPVQQEPNQVSCPSADGFCDTGLADLIVNQIAVEQQNIVTDPLLNAWHDASGNEATDECRNFFAPTTGGSYAALPGSHAGTLSNQVLDGHAYLLNAAFNMAALRTNYPGVPCITGIRLEPSFTAPSPVNTGDVVSFDGMESDITLDAAASYAGSTPTSNYATYSWSFGDGSPAVTGYAPGAPACESPWLSPCAASVFHTYRYGGSYEVTLTVTDVGGDTASVTHEVTVDGTPPPPPGPSSSPPSGSTSSPSSSGTTASAGTTATTLTTGTTTGAGSTLHPSTPPPVPLPVVAAAITSRSLRSVLRKGLVVRYSVNEQVAGHFEVLLASATAHRLHIAGAPATGLPAGTPPEVIIAKAILVTTRGGRSSVDIQLPARTAARLKRMRKVSLMLRLIVRNAASQSPASTTVLSKVTLSG